MFRDVWMDICDVTFRFFCYIDDQRVKFQPPMSILTVLSSSFIGFSSQCFLYNMTDPDMNKTAAQTVGKVPSGKLT